MLSLAVAVLGLALIVAAGARDALLRDPRTRIVKLSRFGDSADAPAEGPHGAGELTVRPVFANVNEGDVYHTRYEVAMQARSEVKVLLLEAWAPSVLGVRFDDVRILDQEAGAGTGNAWATVSDPPFVFRLDVLTTGPEHEIQLRGSIR